MRSLSCSLEELLAAISHVWSINALASLIHGSTSFPNIHLFPHQISVFSALLKPRSYLPLDQSSFQSNNTTTQRNGTQVEAVPAFSHTSTRLNLTKYTHNSTQKTTNPFNSNQLNSSLYHRGPANANGNSNDGELRPNPPKHSPRGRSRVLRVPQRP